MNEPWFGARITGPDCGTFSLEIDRACFSEPQRHTVVERGPRSYEPARYTSRAAVAWLRDVGVRGLMTYTNVGVLFGE